MTPTPRLALRRDGIAIALASFLICHLLAQVTLYGDGPQFVAWMTIGVQRHRLHYFYLPLVYEFSALLKPLGYNLYASACMLSALGTAVGVAFAHAGCRRLALSRIHCALIAGLVATSPGVLFFGTVFEVHGAFLAFAGVAFFAAASLVKKDSWLRAILLGVATGGATAIHASGIALPVAFGFWALAEAQVRGTPIRPFLLRLMLAMGVHAAVVITLWLVVLSTKTMTTDPISFMGEYAWTDSIFVSLGLTVWREWLWAFFPCSFMFLIGWRRPGLRYHVAALGLSLIPYLGVCLKLIPDRNEHGAYLLPLAMTVAWIVTRSFGHAVALGALLLQLIIGTAVILEHDKPEASRQLAAGIRAVGGEDPVLFVVTLDGMQCCLSYLTEAQMIWFGNVMSMQQPQTGVLIDQARALFKRVGESDRAILMTAAVDSTLRQQVEAGRPSAIALDKFFREECEITEITEGGFVGRRLRLRQD